MSAFPFCADYRHSHISTDCSTWNGGSRIERLISDNVEADKMPVDLAGPLLSMPAGP